MKFELLLENWKRRIKEMSEGKPKAAVLFDGAGFARLGLEQAGWDCTGFELNPIAHWLGSHIGEGKSYLKDVRDVDLSSYDAVWASPPCQIHSVANNQQSATEGKYKVDLLNWSLEIPQRFPNVKFLWVENVSKYKKKENEWGSVYNAAQFGEEPRQNRNRVIGGNFPEPEVEREYKRYYYELKDKVCPAITASEWKWSKTDKRRANRWFYEKLGRKATYHELAYRMGLDEVPSEWDEVYNKLLELEKLPRKERRDSLSDIENQVGWSQEYPNTNLTTKRWRNELIRAIGNGVYVPMAKRLGETALKDFHKEE